MPLTEHEAVVGARVRTLVDFADVPDGTQAVIEHDYGTGVMLAWDLPGAPLRDGFDKTRDLRFLELVAPPGRR